MDPKRLSYILNIKVFAFSYTAETEILSVDFVY